MAMRHITTVMSRVAIASIESWPGSTVFPAPVADLRHVAAMRVDVAAVLGELFHQAALETRPRITALRYARDGIHHEVESIEIVQHRHVEGRGDGAFLLVAAHVDVVVVGAPVSQAVNEPRISMEREDDRLVAREERVEGLVAQAMR